MSSDSGEFFYFGICHFCKNGFEIQRCSSCKMVAYCSKQHQKSDWRNHKDLCKAIALTSKNTKTENFTFEEWKNYRIACQMAWIDALKRKLQPFECQMWMFPRICSVCYGKDNLIDCNECRNVAYCSSAHMRKHDEHKRFCSELKLCMNVDRYLAKANTYPQIDFKRKFFVNQFPKDIENLMEMVEEGKDRRSYAWILKADSIASGATILYAIKITKIMQVERDFIVHIVGASLSEATADWRIITEFLFHWVEQLRRITYIFIGPEALDVFEFELCKACKDARKVAKVKVYKQLYHDVIDSIPMPDLVVSFNSGLHEFEGQNSDLWKESICLLTRKNVPFVFTSYTADEMMKDLERISDESISVLMCGKNPFASPRPIRDWYTEDVPVFYSNGCITIVRKL